MPFGNFLIWVPDGYPKTLKELLSEPLDVIYIIRKQVERAEALKEVKQ